MSPHSMTHPALSGLALVGILAVTGAQAAQRATPTFSIDVAADCNRYIENAAQPAVGDSFIQEGVIYRPGTLAAHCPNGNGCGLEADGTPEFPEAVIGRWRCWGSFVDAREGGPPVYSTQVYELSFAAADGEVTQTRIGFNQTQCENYTFDFKLRTQTRSWR